MTNTNTSGDIIERKDKRVWSKYNPSLVKRIDVLLDTSFLDSWRDDVEKENDGKVGHPYEYPKEFFIFLSKVRELWNVPFRELEGFVRKLSQLTGKFRPLSYVAILQRIRSIPGIDPITGAIILGKVCGINRFENAEKLVAFAGIDLVIKESGKRRSQRAISKRGDPTLRSAYQSALAAIRGNPVISEFYHRKVEGGMPRKKAMVAASRKQCHIIWFVWHNNKPFELPEKFRKQE